MAQNPNKFPLAGDDGESIEARLFKVTSRLENAASDLQDLVDQLRLSYRESENDFNNTINRSEDAPDGPEWNEFDNPGASGPSGPSGPGPQDGGASGEGTSGSNPDNPN